MHVHVLVLYRHHLGGDSLQQLPLSEREEEEEEEEEEKEEVEEEEKEEGEEGRREEGEEGQQGEGEGGEEEDTLTPPTTSPSSAVVGVASASSMAQTRSMASLQGKTVFRQVGSTLLAGCCLGSYIHVHVHVYTVHVHEERLGNNYF